MSEDLNKIPLLDLKEQYLAIKEEINQAISRVVESQGFILGKEVEDFETELCNYIGCKFSIGVSSGTDALLLSLMSLGIQAGDEVITTPYTFFATAGSIARLGAKPVFVDIDPISYDIDPKKIEKVVSNKTKAIMPVHLFGQVAEMSLISQIAQAHNFRVIEDAAQAIGAKYINKQAGVLGDFGCFSFFPSKNLGGFGDSGLISTDDPDLAQRARKLRVHGGERRYYHEEVGGNFRIDALQAAILRVKLKSLDLWAERRRENAKYYNTLFCSSGLSTVPNLTNTKEHPVVLPQELEHRYHVYNQYVIKVEKRDELMEFLANNGITTAIYYPLPLHLQGCFSHLGYKVGDFPNSEELAKKSLALPIFPELKKQQIEKVVSVIKKFYE